MCAEIGKYGVWGLVGLLLVYLVSHKTVFAPPVEETTLSELAPPPAFPPTYKEAHSAFRNPWAIEPVYVGNIDSETLWLARVMFSESKRHDEQELVGWVLRNRVESEYRGCKSYQGCVLDPFQFSAFIPGQPKLDYYTGLTEISIVPGWQRTLALAFYIRHADDQLRPFGHRVRHFYSEQSMLDPGVAPDWVGDFSPVVPARNIRLDESRFRFYGGVQ